MSVAARGAVLMVVALAVAEGCGSRPTAAESRHAETLLADAARPIPRLVDLGAG
jgi:hypothetical protein